ncbi:MAG TPA: hypothetical protein VN457_06345, partial [Chlamydiales bacterium]|nr:hypothetical protein [Chlamydiales bacterium]
LHYLLEKGYASMALDINIPFINSKTCTCIDTEFAPRKYHLKRVKKYFSPKMQAYWDTLQ